MKVIAAVLCLSCLVLWSALPAVAQETSRNVRVAAEVPLSALMSLTERYLTGTLQALQVAACSTEVQSGDWQQMRSVLACTNAGGAEAVIWFANLDGSYATLDKGPTGLSLSDRAYFPKLVRGEQVLGDLVISKSTGRNTAIVAVPVKREGKVIGGVGASIYLDSLSERLTKDMALPEDMIFFALDPSGKVTTLNATTQRIFLDPAAVGSPSLAQAVTLMLQRDRGTVAYDFAGARRLGVYATSPVLKWHFLLAVVTR